MMKKLILILVVLIFISATPAMACLLIASSEGVATDQMNGSNHPNGILDNFLNKASYESFIPGFNNANQRDQATVKFGGGKKGPFHNAFMDEGDAMLSSFGNKDSFHGFKHLKDHISCSSSPNPVPEPTTMLLLGLGLVGMAGVGRKKFNR